MERSYLMNQAFLSAWREREPGAVVFPFLFPAFSYPPSPKDYESSRAMLAERLKDRPPNLIVAHGDPSLNLALPLRDRYFPGTPIVSYEITTPMITLLAGVPALYQIDTFNFGFANVELAHRLFPKAGTVVLLSFVGPDPKPYLSYVAELRRQFPDLGFEVVLNPTAGSVDAALRSASKNSVVLNFSPGLINGEGRFIFGKEHIRFLTDTYGLPVFEFLREDAGGGLVGGVGVAADAWGKAAAAMGLALLLDGKEPEPLNSSEKLSRAFVDYRALVRFGSSIRLAPSGAELMNMPPPVWIRYQFAFQATIVAMLLALSSLVVHLLYRRRERGRLLRSNESLELQVAERTSELSVFNEELAASNENLVAAMRRAEEMQEKVLHSAREVTLGRLTAGIANEINSPLNAARSANAVMRSVLWDEEGGLASRLLSMDEGQRSLFRRYVPRVIARSARAQPALRGPSMELERRLERLSCANASSVASDLAESGLSDLGDAEAAEFSGERAGAVAQALYRLGICHGSTGIIEAAVERATSAIDAVREYLSGYRADGEDGTVNLGDTIDRALALFRNRMPASIALRTDFQEIPPLRGSEAIFVRLWVHLIQNALQAMEGGGLLRISLRKEGNSALVLVDDEGIGIDPAVADRVFEPFYTTKPFAEGMGLGLAYCRRILDSLNGTISYASKDRGTVFSIRIPYGEVA
jgi:signal transduction histidine kinase